MHQQPQIDGQLDDELIKEKVLQLKQKFLLGHQKSQIKHKNGIVFIGNSRVGKSTLAALICGILMQRKLSKGNTVVIEPIEQRYRKQENLIQHTFTSVTSYPNIHNMQINNEYYTTVDLPGFMDTSPQKQLCNWSYIKNILQQLQNILFVMVLHVHSQTLTLKTDEINMMKRFMQAFPCNEKSMAKQNLCIVVNFVQNVQTQDKLVKMKQTIIKGLDKLLKELNMGEFYSKSLQPSKVLLIEKARKDNLLLQHNNNKNNKSQQEPYTIPTLLPFIKSHLTRLQSPLPSRYKIDLSNTNNTKTEQLREVIRQFVQETIKQIGQRIQLYKHFLSETLLLLAQTQGVQCGIQHYGKLQNYTYKNKLAIYNSIQLPKQYTNIINSNKNISTANNLLVLSQHLLSSQSTQQIVFQIVELFNTMNLQKQFQTNTDSINNLLLRSIQFVALVDKLATKVFDINRQYKQFHTITQTIKKAIYIDCLDLQCINDNVGDFMVQIDSIDQLQFSKLFKSVLFDTYSDEIIRISSFKDNLKDYLEVLLKKYHDMPVNKISISTLRRFRQACLTTNIRQLRLKSSLVIFKCVHSKLYNIHFINNIELLQRMISQQQQLFMISPTQNNKNNHDQQKNNKNNIIITFTKDQLQHIWQWKIQQQQRQRQQKQQPVQARQKIPQQTLQQQFQKKQKFIQQFDKKIQVQQPQVNEQNRLLIQILLQKQIQKQLAQQLKQQQLVKKFTKKLPKQQKHQQKQSLSLTQTHSSQWQCIKGKNYMFLLKLLTKTNYTNKHQLLQLYMNITNTNDQQIMIILQSIITDIQYQQYINQQEHYANKLKAYELCMQVKQHMVNSYHFIEALRCCTLAKSIYMYEDVKKCKSAQYEYMQVMKLLILSQSQSHNDILEQLQQQSMSINNINPWTNISDNLYYKLINIVYSHCQNIINNNTKQHYQSINSNTNLKNNTNQTSSPNNYNNRNTTIRQVPLSSSISMFEQEISQKDIMRRRIMTSNDKIKNTSGINSNNSIIQSPTVKQQQQQKQQPPKPKFKGFKIK